jgi:hypothetical protein
LSDGPEKWEEPSEDLERDRLCISDWAPGEIGEVSFGGPANWKLGVGMKPEIDLGLCDVRLGLTEIVGRSLGSALDFEPEDGIYEIGRVL